MSSHTMSGFAAWYVEWVLGIVCAGILLHWIWEKAVKHGRRLESRSASNQVWNVLNSIADMHDEVVSSDTLDELEEMYNRPNLFDQDAE